MAEPPVYHEVWDPTLDLRVCAQCGIPVGARPCPQHAPKVLTFFERLEERPLRQHTESVRRRAGRARDAIERGGTAIRGGAGSAWRATGTVTGGATASAWGTTERAAVATWRVIGRTLTAIKAGLSRWLPRPVVAWFAAVWLAIHSRATFLPAGFRVRPSEPAAVWSRLRAIVQRLSGRSHRTRDPKHRAN